MSPVTETNRAKHESTSLNTRAGSGVRDPATMTLEEIIAARGERVYTMREIADEWAGVFEPAYWEEVLRVVQMR